MTHPESMVERVARAIHDAQFAGGSYDDLCEDSQNDLWVQARAAIAAMRLPLFFAIDAALSDGTGGGK